MKTNVYFTIDTEASMGGAWSNPERRPVPAPRHVFCRIGGRPFGIPLIVDLMARYGFRATYFVETLATRVLGESDTASIFDYLLRYGQDVQLHVHPNFRYYAEFRQAQAEGRPYQVPHPSDLLGHFAENIQRDLLSEAADFFQRFAGRRPTAFRAGCYSASRATMRCLAALGMKVDSSLNPCYPDLSFPGERLEPNRVQEIEGVWELPVTVACTKLPEGYNGFKFADCTSMASSELRQMLDAAAAGGQEHFMMIFHSFSAVKAKDVSYTELRPNSIVIRRLEKLFRYLAENSNRFQMATVGEAAANPSLLESSSNTVVPELGFLRAGLRKAVQLINTPYWV
jgi:hypothetical protein